MLYTALSADVFLPCVAYMQIAAMLSYTSHISIRWRPLFFVVLALSSYFGTMSDGSEMSVTDEAVVNN